MIFFYDFDMISGCVQIMYQVRRYFKITDQDYKRNGQFCLNIGGECDQFDECIKIIK